MNHFLFRQRLRGPCVLAAVAAPLLTPATASASLLQGEALDTMAEVVSWVAIVVAPLVLITVFWILHIMPEKIAEKRKHPQAKAIQCLCLLSLFFGGLLWPIAWLWAYSKPVLHKLAYGTDVDESHGAPAAASTTEKPDPSELERLRARVAELESQNSRKGGQA